MDRVLDILEKPAGAVIQSRGGLTVDDAIAMLRTFDPAALVLIAGEYGGLDEVLGFRKTPVRLNVNDADGFGPHEVPAHGERAYTVAVVVRTHE